MRDKRRVGGWFAVAFVAFASMGCGVEFAPLEAQDAWSARGAPLAEPMLPAHETWTVSDRSPRHQFWRSGSIGGSFFNGHVACGPEDDACAARLRSAPVHAGDWQNRFPIF